jgi:hypothetical protein
VERIARANRSMGSYRSSEDDVRNVMTSVFERLRRDDFRALRTFPAWRDNHPGKGIADWLTIVTVNVIRSYIAGKLGAPADDGTSIKQLVNTLAEALPGDDASPGYRAHFTAKGAARRIYEYACDHLPEDQLDALRGWLEGRTFDEIARELELGDADLAARLVRAAIARLRREFDHG